MTDMNPRITIVGAGLAGSELALQLAAGSIPVRLVEMKPGHKSEAHRSDRFAELVCSNSLRAADIGNAVGLLKEEMRRLGSFIMAAADLTRVPAGGALAVDRERFSETTHRFIESHPLITVEHRLVTDLPGPDQGLTVLATGPLTHPDLLARLANLTGEPPAFYDAIAPIVAADSIDMTRAFFKSRYDKGDSSDYLNLPLTRPQYEALHQAILTARRVPPRPFEDPRYFEGCMPIETLCDRGLETPCFGPMKPVGLEHPESGEQFAAVVQLRKENQEGSAYNMVGFQTRMTHPEQERVLRMIPGLENARFLRLGTVHRNTFVNAPRILNPDLSLKAAPHLFLAGQITGVEGYVESAACGLLLSYLLRARLAGLSLPPWPPETACGSLLSHLAREQEDFQPSNIHFGLFPTFDQRVRKRDRGHHRAAWALSALERWLAASPVPPAGPRCHTPASLLDPKE